jgi:hypothetical protein
MVEIIFVLVISIFTFLFLFLALVLKNKSRNESPQIPTCQTCNCHKKVLLEKEKSRVLEVVSKPQIRLKSKAQADEKAQHTRHSM